MGKAQTYYMKIKISLGWGEQTFKSFFNSKSKTFLRINDLDNVVWKENFLSFNERHKTLFEIPH